MVIAINDTLLESIKKELLATLKSAESRVVDMFEFGETHGSDETLSLLLSAKNTLLMIGEQGAATLCDAVLTTIKQALSDKTIEEHGNLADSFLTLMQYVERLSVDGEQAYDALLKIQLLDEAKRALIGGAKVPVKVEEGYALTDEQKQVFEKVKLFLSRLSEIDVPSFWQGMYKIAKATKQQLETRENYEYVWLVEQTAILNIKGAAKTEPQAQQQLFAYFCAYVNLLLKEGETLSGYQSIAVDAMTQLKQLTSSSELVRNDYAPPMNCLLADDDSEEQGLSLSIVFPVSADTIETIAFLIKKELATTKSLFDKALQEDSLGSAVVKEQLLRSFLPAKATFKLLGFSTGYVLVEEAENYLNARDTSTDWQQQFAECVILIEDALWELDSLENSGMVNPYDAIHRQTAHTTKMATVAAKLITAQSAHEFFRGARDRLIESFAETGRLDLMHDAKSIHDMYSAMTLLSEEALATQLKKTEQALLFLANKPEALAETDNTNAYLDVVVGYEIVFEQLRHSKTVDDRALSLLENELQKLLSGIRFNIEQMAPADYAGVHQPTEATDSLVDGLDALDNDLSATEEAEQELEDEKDSHADSSEGTETDDNQGVLANTLEKAVINEDVQSVAASEMDEEILEIFLEEAQDISAQLENDIRSLRGNYFDEALTVDIRRAFHTLKGSGRMVGLNVFGEFAWQHEELFNKVVSGELQLNDISQDWLEKAQALVANTINTEPFREDRDALLRAAANAEAIRKALMSGDLEEAPANVGDTSSGASAVEALSDENIDGLAERLATRQAMQSQTEDMLNGISGHQALTGGSGVGEHLLSASDDVVAEEVDVDLAIDDISWTLDYAQTTKDLFGQWSEEGYLKESVFNGLQQNSITLEQMLLNSRIETPIAVSSKLRQVIDEIARRRVNRIGLAQDVTSPIGEGIDEVIRLLSAIHSKQDNVVSSAEILASLDRALIQVQTRYETYSQAASGSGASMGSGLVNAARYSEIKSSNSEEKDESLANTPSSADIPLSEYIDEAAVSIKAAKTGFSAWQKANYDDADVLKGLREDVKVLRDGAYEVNHLDSRFITQAIYDTLGHIKRSEKAPTDSEAKAVKYALDELMRIHGEILDGDIGEANPLVLNSLAEASNSILGFSPNEVQPASPIPGISSSLVSEANLDDVTEQITATAYLGQAGDLNEQIEAAKREFTPTNFVAGAVQHNELIDALYDVEASLDEQASPTWAWEMLSNLEGAITNMQSKSLFPSPDDYTAISDALDAIADSKDVDAKQAKKINNSLMGIRAGLNSRQQIKELAGKFASEAKEALDSTDDAFDAWKISGFTPSDVLSELIGGVDTVDVKAEELEYDEASELSTLVNSVLKRLKQENLIPYDMVSETVEQAISEMTAVLPKVHGGSLSSPELKDMLDEHAIVTSVGVKYVPLNDIDNLDDEAIVGTDSVDQVVTRVVEKMSMQDALNAEASSSSMPINVPATEGTQSTPLSTENQLPVSNQEAVVPNANQPADTASVSANKKGFAKDATPFVDESRTHFDHWENTGFTDGEPLGRLSSSFKNISRVSNEHDFQDAYDLANTVNDVLERVQNEVDVPHSETTRSVSNAIDEFDITTQAINRDDTSPGAQSISPSLLGKMRAIAEMKSLGTPIASVADSANEVNSAATIASEQTTDEVVAPQKMGDSDSVDSVSPSNAPVSQSSSQTFDDDFASAEGTPIDKQGFAQEAAPHVRDSRSHFDDWENTGFADHEPLERLSGSFKQISQSSSAYQFKDAYDLADTVNDVLERVQNEVDVPNTETTRSVSEAIDEFDTTTQAITGGDVSKGAQSINPSLLDKMRTIAAMPSLGQPLPSIAASQLSVDPKQALSGSSEHLSSDILPVESSASVGSGDNSSADVMAQQMAGSKQESLYQPYAVEAVPTINASQDSFDHWKAADFSLDERLQQLSDNVQGITDISEKHDFSSGARLGEAVSHILSRISEAGVKPTPETTDQVESAINEFSRSAQAIQQNTSYQDIQEEVLTQIARVTSAVSEGAATALTSSVAAHEMFVQPSSAAKNPLQEQLSKRLSSAAGSEAVNIGGIVSASSDISSVASQLGGASTTSEKSELVPYNGLKFNDPNELDEVILDIFLDEARDIVKNNDNSLSDWQADYGDLSALQEMQRGLHTLKGGARMAELTVLGDISHNIETLLDAIVDGNIDDKDTASVLLSAGLKLTDNMVVLADNRQAVVESPEYYASMSDFLRDEIGNVSDLVAPRPPVTVTPSMDGDGVATHAEAPTSTATAPTATTRAPSKVTSGSRSQRRSSYMVRVSSDLIDSLTGLIGEELILRSRQERKLADHGFQIDELSRTVDRVSEQLRRLENETEAQILFRHDNTEEFDDNFDPLELDRFSEIQQLSRLLAESMHDLQSIRSTLTDYVDETRQILIDQNNIQRELQDGVLSASLVRFDSVEKRIGRLVEQVSEELGKEVEIQIYGGQNDIERNMLEELIPGFEHTIRNSLAHGIEMPNEREKAGKPRKGRIRIGVRREGAEIGFVISDDGRGVNLEAIRQKARRLNRLDESRADDKNYLLQLLFEAGFSTQEHATQISGRGIGMDVLKDVVNARQGTIEIETEDNKGMATFIRMPFAMSITEALSVKIGQYRYAVPVMSVEGIARIPYDLYKPFELGQETHYIYGQNRYKLESLIDFIDPYADKVISPQGIPALLVRIGSKRIAFEVEDIENRQEVIIKSVNPQFTSLPGIIGAAVLDSGQAVPVMEASTLGRHFLSFQSISGEIRELIEPEVVAEMTSVPRILVVDDSITMRKVTMKILNKYDVEAQTAKDGLDAVDVINDWIPDVILLDIEMPRMDGFEFATHVRNDSMLKDVPIIMITSRTGEKHRERAATIGVNDYLGKPYSEDTLLASLQGVLGKALKK